MTCETELQIRCEIWFEVLNGSVCEWHHLSRVLRPRLQGNWTWQVLWYLTKTEFQYNAPHNKNHKKTGSQNNSCSQWNGKDKHFGLVSLKVCPVDDCQSWHLLGREDRLEKWRCKDLSGRKALGRQGPRGHIETHRLTWQILKAKRINATYLINTHSNMCKIKHHVTNTPHNDNLLYF